MKKIINSLIISIWSIALPVFSFDATDVMFWEKVDSQICLEALASYDNASAKYTIHESSVDHETDIRLEDDNRNYAIKRTKLVIFGISQQGNSGVFSSNKPDGLEIYRYESTIFIGQKAWHYSGEFIHGAHKCYRKTGE